MNGANAQYIAGKLFGGDERVVDYQAISDAIGSEVERDTMMWYLDELKETYGPDWMMDLPNKTSDDYAYLCRIVEAVKEAISQHCI